MKAAPPIFPFPDHKPLKTTGRKPFAGHMTVMKGWWPSTMAGFDMMGRRTCSPYKHRLL